MTNESGTPFFFGKRAALRTSKGDFALMALLLTKRKFFERVKFLIADFEMLF